MYTWGRGHGVGGINQTSIRTEGTSSVISLFCHKIIIIKKKKKVIQDVTNHGSAEGKLKNEETQEKPETISCLTIRRHFSPKHQPMKRSRKHAESNSDF